jgi:glycerol-3-phosphate dehydrogenase (NAD(P)+)
VLTRHGRRLDTRPTATSAAIVSALEMRVAVLGGGSWGTTMASLLAPRHPTILWARDPEVARAVDSEHANPVYLPGFELSPQLRATSDLVEVSEHADLLIVGVPSSGFRKVLDDAKPYLRPWIPVVSLSKGLERGSLLRMTEVIKEVLPGHPAAALTGPNIAKEILSGKAAAAVIATEDLDVASEIQKVVTRGVFRVYVNHDVIGCEIGGALKNVVAIASGIGEGLGVGDNTRAAVIARGLAELARLGVAMGAEPMTFAGLAGVGDLIATCMSPYSRNRAVGEQLGRGKKLSAILDEMRMVAEGVNTATLVLDLAARYDVEMPICKMIDRVVQGEIAPADAYFGLTPAGHEADPG